MLQAFEFLNQQVRIRGSCVAAVEADGLLTYLRRGSNALPGGKLGGLLRSLGDCGLRRLGEGYPEVVPWVSVPDEGMGEQEIQAKSVAVKPFQGRTRGVQSTRFAG